MGEAMEMGEGERLEQARRRKFWFVVGVIAGAGAVAGFISGFAAGYGKVPLDEVWTTMPDALVISLVGATLIVFTIGCWAFARSIDEVELADNLWGSTAAYYIYATMFPAWWALSKAGIVSEPNHWLIFFAALGAGGATYLWRKWRAH